MTTALITNAVLITVVFAVMVGMLAWSIRSSARLTVRPARIRVARPRSAQSRAYGSANSLSA